MRAIHGKAYAMKEGETSFETGMKIHPAVNVDFCLLRTPTGSDKLLSIYSRITKNFIKQHLF